MKRQAILSVLTVTIFLIGAWSLQSDQPGCSRCHSRQGLLRWRVFLVHGGSLRES